MLTFAACFIAYLCGMKIKKQKTNIMRRKENSTRFKNPMHEKLNIIIPSCNDYLTKQDIISILKLTQQNLIDAGFSEKELADLNIKKGNK